MNIPELYKVYLKHRLVSTDTRREVAGSLFFALRGESFNGNAFAREAIEKGAAYAVVDEGEYPDEPGIIRVEDSLGALQQLAGYHRQQLKATIIAITGSNGKTTTKELFREVLARKYKVYATAGNLNNHIGVPLSVLRIGPDVQFAIIEMGANHIGEIEELCHIAQPGYGIITNVGRAHLEGFGSFEGVKKAKGELYRYLSEENGKIFIHSDNPELMQMSEGFRGDLISYGSSPDAVCNASVKSIHPYLSVSIRWHHEPDREYPCASKLVGSYNLENILAAVCAGSHFDVERDDIIAAVEEYTPGMMRSQLIETDRNLIVGDSYNANPSSMEPAIRDFAEDPHPEKILILGEMKELGGTEFEEHEKLIEYLSGMSFSTVILIGPVFSKINLPDGYLTFRTTGECREWLEDHPVGNAKILLKGSRLLRLEELMSWL